MGLRLLSIGLVILAMLRPTLVWTTVTQRPATLIVLADSSRSMQVADVVGNKSRWDALRTALDEAWPELANLDDELELKLYTFDSQTQERDVSLGQPDLPERPEGDQTALGVVLDEVLRREAGKRIAAVIVLSDGAQRAMAGKDLPPQMPARRMADLGNPLYALPLGQSRSLDQTRDVALTELRANQTVFVKNPLDVGALAQATGFVNQDVPVQLLVETAPGKMEVVATTKVRADAAGSKLPINLEYVPPTSGEIKVTLKAADQPGELVTTNNELSTFVTVLDGGLNVLYLNGAILPEQNFLRRSLDASPDINVDYLYLNARKPQTKPSDLVERFKPGKYNVYILGDLDSKAFTTEELTALRTAVEKGAGLIMLGGLHSFGAGGYGSDALGRRAADQDRLHRTAELRRADPHRFAPAGKPQAADAAHAVRPFAQPDAVGAGRAERRRLGQTAAAWMGPIASPAIKPGAGVLAETTDGKPLLVAQEFGAGRVLAFAGDSTWRWVMGGQEAAHKRFWRQVVLWLRARTTRPAGSVWIRLDQTTLRPGQPRGVRRRRENGRRRAGARRRASTPWSSIVPIAARQFRFGCAAKADETAGTFAMHWRPATTRWKSRPRCAAQPLGEAQGPLPRVYEQDLELDNPAADRGALEGLAAMTGGKTLAPKQLPKLVEQIRKQLHDLEVETQIKETLWDNWPFFVLLVSVLGLEWYLRKKWGLV